MRFVRQVATLADGFRSDQQAPIFFAHAVARHLVRLVSRLTLAAATMKAVLVPGTDHHLAFEDALAERSAHVVAEIGDDAELPILERNGDQPLAELRLAQRRALE